MNTKTVSLSDYTITLGDFQNTLAALLAEGNYSQVFVLVDENTKAHCLPILLEKLPVLQEAMVIQIQSGEIHKNIQTCQSIWSQLLAAQADRNALLLNLGGGVIGDMGGFAAAAYKRGIRFIQIPTTLLAQVDASIGGKLGIDFDNLKNVIGFFQNPQAVLIDPIFLQTLPARQIRNGFAEIIKHALIADAGYFQDLLTINRDNIETVNWSDIIMRSLQIKKSVVEADPFEKGWRKILNFGHTVGHAVESFSLEHDADPLLHGEAIHLGMMAELKLSIQKTDFPANEYEQIRHFMQQLYDPYELAAANFDSVMAYLQNDKKHDAKQLNFTLLEAIGKPIINQYLKKEDIVKSF
ncbi:MAG: 3-dehydroquinate synthase [Chitinophagales bacterium]